MSRKPKNLDLPGMADRRIPELHEAALIYCGIRDERMSLTEKEVAAKKEVQEVMHRFNMKSYVFEGVEISLEPGEESVKVKVHKTAEPGGTPAEPEGMTDQEFNEHLDKQDATSEGELVDAEYVEVSAPAGEPVGPEDGADFELPE